MLRPLTFATLLLTAGATAQAGVPTTRVLVVGDSWAEFLWLNRSLETVFAANGRPDLVEDGATTSESGSTAADWAAPAMLQAITDALTAQPTIDVVQISIGGNDFLAGMPGGGWHTGLTPGEVDALEASILGDLETVVDHVLGLDPDLEVLISLYDYANFEDSSLFTCPGTWNDLGQPTTRQLNEALTAFQETVDGFAASRSRVVSVSHLGLMQWAFGFPGSGIAPGDLNPPGDLDRPSPIEAMLLGIDCFHLSGTGYEILAQNLWDAFYDGWFHQNVFDDGFETGDTTRWDSGS